MELEKFNVGVIRNEQKDEKVYYVILVQYKELKYEVNKRYSEFEELNCELLNLGFSALPHLPKKKFMSYRNVGYIKYRETCLNEYIQELFIRPDTRCCAVFLNFLNFFDKINVSVDMVRTKLVNNTGAQKFSLVDMYINEKQHFIIAIYEDRSSLSKLGKLWSIIEPDIVGEIKIYSYNNDLTSSLTEKYKEQIIYKAKNILYIEEKDQIFISGDDGHIHIYQMDYELFTLNFVKKIHCHNDTILKMMQLNNLLCTCGYDNAFRLFVLDDPKEECKIISGGRCNNRLKNDKITTCHLFEENNIILGTDDALILIFNMSTNTPTFLASKKIIKGKRINCFANSDKYIFVGCDYVIACYQYHYCYGLHLKQTKGEDGNIVTVAYQKKYDNDEEEEERKNGVSKQNEKRMLRLVIDTCMSAQYIPPLSYDNNIKTMCVVKSKKILIAGYSDAIIIWSITHGLIISSIHGHTSGVYCIKYLNSVDLFLSGGNGGNLKIWNTNLENLKFWKPKNMLKINENSGARNYVKSQDFRSNQDNFIFNESDNEHNRSDDDDDDKNSALSEPISIDNILDSNVKKEKFQVCDTSDYKQNIINYNQSIHNNNNNTKTTSFTNPTYALFNKGETNQYIPLHYETNNTNVNIYNDDTNHNKPSFEHLFDKGVSIEANPNDVNCDFQLDATNRNSINHLSLGNYNKPININDINIDMNNINNVNDMNIDMVSVDHGKMNQVSFHNIDMNDMNFNDVNIEDNDIMYNMNIQKNHDHNNNNMMHNLNIENWNNINTQNIAAHNSTYSNTMQNPNALDNNTEHVKKNIVHISDEEEEEEDNEDLISAFR